LFEGFADAEDYGEAAGEGGCGFAGDELGKLVTVVLELSRACYAVSILFLKNCPWYLIDSELPFSFLIYDIPYHPLP
jgi:hypothetical protein